jgi:hypothetical protein
LISPLAFASLDFRLEGFLAVAALVLVKGATLLFNSGLLLLVLERLPEFGPGLPVAFSDTAAGVDTRLLRATDRVIGPK